MIILICGGIVSDSYCKQVRQVHQFTFTWDKIMFLIRSCTTWSGSDRMALTHVI